MYIAVSEYTAGQNSRYLRLSMTPMEMGEITGLKYLPEWLKFDMWKKDDETLHLRISRTGKNTVNTSQKGGNPTCSKSLRPLGIELNIQRKSVPCDFELHKTTGVSFKEVLIRIPKVLRQKGSADEQIPLKLEVATQPRPKQAKAMEDSRESGSMENQVQKALDLLSTALARAGREGFFPTICFWNGKKVQITLENKRTLDLS